MTHYTVKAYGLGWYTVTVEAKNVKEAEKRFYDGQFDKVDDWKMTPESIVDVIKQDTGAK